MWELEEYHCEDCGADMRSEHDEDGTGNLTENGWICDDCLDRLEWDRLEEEQ